MLRCCLLMLLIFLLKTKGSSKRHQQMNTCFALVMLGSAEIGRLKLFESPLLMQEI